ncbi:sensor histidine kinase [Paenibacillus sp. J5C2022]|uniref:sensor histidine kinase n=1 Tax=Paenibacillus sp. J5C2022 TaxID=2977129 RepID=UPI0021CEBEFA|nr:histidine kinase [Paenibacillus sp. J5C2022]
MLRTYGASFKMNVFRALLLITLPLIGLLLAFNIYSYNAFNNKFVESNQQSLSLYAQNMQTDLETLDAFLTHVTVNDYNFRILSSPAKTLQSHVASHEIMTQLKAALNSYDIADAFFIYSAVNNTYRDIFANNYSYELKEAVRMQMRHLTYTKANYYHKGWMSFEVQGNYYLFRLLGKDGTYAAVMVDFEQIPAMHLIHEDTKVIYATNEYAPLTNAEFVTEHNVWSNDDYIVVGEPIGGTDVQLIFAVPKPGVFRGGFAILFLLSLLSVLLVMTRLFYLNRSILSPWQRLVTRIGKGSDPEQQEEYRVEEFKRVDAAFTQMTSEINQLKIVAYEHEIERQKAELQHLQLQIKPHFFLNCLKSLYGMAQQQSYERMQNMILAISSHLRYNFRDNLQLVSLQQEVEHVQNYIRIQHIAHHIPPLCEWSVDSELHDFVIPPLSIQAFVENCVKYATKPGVQLHIRVKAVLLQSDEGDYVDITIQDNGDGFQPSILEELNCGDSSFYTDIHVGVSNVRHRLSMLYGDRATLAFFNIGEGAAAEMILPVNSRMNRQEEAS